MKWLRHSSESRFEPALSKLIKEKGMEGYGAYWVILEIMAKSPGKRLKIAKSFHSNFSDKYGIARGEAEDFVHYMTEIGLAKINLSGEVVMVAFEGSIAAASELSDKRRKAAKVRWGSAPKDKKKPKEPIVLIFDDGEPAKVVEAEKTPSSSLTNITSDKLWSEFKVKLLKHKAISSFGYTESWPFDAERHLYSTHRVSEKNKNHFNGFANWMIRDWMREKYFVKSNDGYTLKTAATTKSIERKR